MVGSGGCLVAAVAVAVFAAVVVAAAVAAFVATLLLCCSVSLLLCCSAAQLSRCYYSAAVLPLLFCCSVVSLLLLCCYSVAVPATPCLRSRSRRVCVLRQSSRSSNLSLHSQAASHVRWTSFHAPSPLAPSIHLVPQLSHHRIQFAQNSLRVLVLLVGLLPRVVVLDWVHARAFLHRIGAVGLRSLCYNLPVPKHLLVV